MLDKHHKQRKSGPGSEFIGIIGYLIGLKELQDRGQALGGLRILLDKINTTFKETIKVNFKITTDLEFKGAVKRSFPLQDFLVLYNGEFGKSVGTHFGIGLGELGFTQEKKPGGCFYAAAKALSEAKNKGEFLIFHRFEMNLALNALFYFIHEMDERMTDRQRLVVESYRKNGNLVSVANELYLPKQAVADLIKAARYEVFNKAWLGLYELLRCKISTPAPLDHGRPGRKADYGKPSRKTGYHKPSLKTGHNTYGQEVWLRKRETRKKEE
ncbi:MAG: SatD family protein [bacterium]